MLKADRWNGGGVISIKWVVVGVFLFIAATVAAFFFGKSQGGTVVNVNDTVTVVKWERDSVYFPVYYPRIQYVKDTVFAVRFRELDSLQLAILNEWKTTVTDTTQDYGHFIAEMDTVLPDNLGRVQIWHTSRIPFDPQGYFTGRFEINHKTVTQTVYLPRERGFWETYFHFGLVAAMGYGFGSQRADAFIGIGAMLGL